MITRWPFTLRPKDWLLQDENTKKNMSTFLGHFCFNNVVRSIRYRKIENSHSSHNTMIQLGLNCIAKIHFLLIFESIKWCIVHQCIIYHTCSPFSCSEKVEKPKNVRSRFTIFLDIAEIFYNEHTFVEAHPYSHQKVWKNPAKMSIGKGNTTQSRPGLHYTGLLSYQVKFSSY